MTSPSSPRSRIPLWLPGILVVVGVVLGCARLQSGPAIDDIQRAMTWFLKKVYAKQYAFPGGNNFFVPGQGARVTVEENGAAVAAPPFFYSILRRYTKNTGGERWFCYEFTATGHLEAGDVTFRGVVALVKRGSTWYFHREDGGAP